MMKKYLATAALLSVAAASLVAQNTDQVILKSGEKIDGKVLELVSGQNVKVRTTDGTVYVYDSASVERVSFGDAQADTQSPAASGNGFAMKFNTGYYATDNDHLGMFEVGIAGGVRLLQGGRLFVGAGVAGNWYNDFGDDYEYDHYYGGGCWEKHDGDIDCISAVPVFAVVSYEFGSSRFAPYVEARPGYSFGTAEGGYMSAAAGCRFLFGQKYRATAGFGIVSQDASVNRYVYNGWHDDVLQHFRGFVSLGVRLGIEF